MIELEIDGKKIKVEEGTTIIEAADALNVYIPRFCYHKKLSIAANCRMCLVEVEKVGKPLPACATPVTPGMKILTQSEKTLDAQRSVMQFLLINHPLDCPICDQGGVCELQDLAMGFGRSYSNYDETKRSVFSQDIGALVETEMTRCIQCTRCVRFGNEIAGLPELGVLERGENSEISTYVQHFLKSELSGNIIDICPVGALTNKPARYEGRGWEYREHPVISPHDCVGSNIFLHTRGQEYALQRKVMQAVPRNNELINEIWISDRDRYGHFGLYDESRVGCPRVKRDNTWCEVSWEEALEQLATQLKQTVAENPDLLAALCSPSSTLEEMYLLQRLMRDLGSSHIDHRMRWQDFSDQNYLPQFLNCGLKISEIEKQNAFLLIGSHVRLEQPLINHRINKACSEGATVCAINSYDYAFNYPLAEKMIVSPQQIVVSLQQILSALQNKNVSDIAKKIANSLKEADKAAIFIGEQGLHSPHSAQIRALAHQIAKLSGASIGVLTDGANSAGAWLAGAIPHRGPAGEKLEKLGLHAKAMLTNKPSKMYLLLNMELESDCAYPATALRALQQANFVVCMTPFASMAMQEYADMILPVAPYTESGGTYVNAEGRWQSFAPVSVPENDSKPAWKVLRVLGNLCNLKGYDYKVQQEVRSELKALLTKAPQHQPCEFPFTAVVEPDQQLWRLAPWSIYQVDQLVRRAKPLQSVFPEEANKLAINSRTAEKLGFQVNQKVMAVQGKSSISLPLSIDDNLADNTVWLASGRHETAGFGCGQGPIILQRGQA